MKKVKVKEKLTEKQTIFVNKFAETGDIKTAAITAYPKNTSIQDGRQAIAYGRRILKHKKVQNEIGKILNNAGLSKKALVLELSKVVMNPEKEDNKIKAIRMGLEMQGAFEQDTTEVEDNVQFFGDIPADSQQEIVRDLVARISQKSGIS